MRWTPIAGLAVVCCVGCTTFTGRFAATTPKYQVVGEIELPEPQPPVAQPTRAPEPETTRIELPPLTDAKPKIPEAERIAQDDALRAARFVRGAEAGDKPAEFAFDRKNYHWVQGRVSRIHVGREKLWKIRYADYHERDPHGGSFLLAGDLPSNLAEGDLVRVEGLVPSAQPEGRNTHYRVHRLTILAARPKAE